MHSADPLLRIRDLGAITGKIQRDGMPESKVEIEDELQQAKSGNKLAFASLVDEHRSMVFSIAYHSLRSAAIAEEVAQDIFLELYRNLERIESATHLMHWLRRSTTNRCIDRSRNSAFRKEIGFDNLPEPRAPTALADGMLTGSLRRLVAGLPEWQRAVVILRYQEEMDPLEIAGTLKVPVNTVKSRLHRALKTLRDRMAKEGARPNDWGF